MDEEDNNHKQVIIQDSNLPIKYLFDKLIDKNVISQRKNQINISLGQLFWMDKTEAEWLIASVKEYFELEAEQCTNELRRQMTKMREELERQKLREEQLERKLEQQKKKCEQKIRELEFQVFEYEKQSEDNLKWTKRNADKVLQKYKEEVEGVIYQTISIEQALSEGTLSASSEKFFKNHDYTNKMLLRIQQEDLKFEIEKMKKERIAEKAQLSKLKRKAELFKHLAESREEQMNESQELVKLLSNLSQKVHEEAEQLIMHWSDRVVESIKERQVRSQKLDERIQKIVIERNQLQKDAAEQQNTSNMQETSLTQEIKELKNVNKKITQQAKQLQQDLDLNKLQHQFQIKKLKEELDNHQQHYNKSLKLFHQNIHDTQFKLKSYYEQILTNWKTSFQTLKKSVSTHKIPEFSSSKIFTDYDNNTESDMNHGLEDVMSELENENKKLQKECISLNEQVILLTTKCNIQDQQIKDGEKQQEFLILNFEQKIQQYSHQKQKDNINSQKNMIDDSTQTDFQQTIANDDSSASKKLLQLQESHENIRRIKSKTQILNPNLQFMQRIRSITEANDEVGQRKNSLGNIQTSNKKYKQFDLTASILERSFFETAKEVWQQLKQDFSGFMPQKKIRECELSEQLLYVLEKQLEDHALEKCKLINELSECRKQQRNEVKRQLDAQTNEWIKEKEQHAMYINKMLEQIKINESQIQIRLDNQDIRKKVSKQLQAVYDDKFNYELKQQFQFIIQMQQQFILLAKIDKKFRSPTKQQQIMPSSSSLGKKLQTESKKNSIIENHPDQEFLNSLLASIRFPLNSSQMNQSQKESKIFSQPKINFGSKKTSIVEENFQENLDDLIESNNLLKQNTQLKRYSRSSCSDYGNKTQQSQKSLYDENIFNSIQVFDSSDFKTENQRTTIDERSNSELNSSITFDNKIKVKKLDHKMQDPISASSFNINQDFISTKKQNEGYQISKMKGSNQLQLQVRSSKYQQQIKERNAQQKTFNMNHSTGFLDPNSSDSFSRQSRAKEKLLFTPEKYAQKKQQSATPIYHKNFEYLNQNQKKLKFNQLTYLNQEKISLQTAKKGQSQTNNLRSSFHS